MDATEHPVNEMSAQITENNEERWTVAIWSSDAVIKYSKVKRLKMAIEFNSFTTR